LRIGKIVDGSSTIILKIKQLLNGIRVPTYTDYYLAPVHISSFLGVIKSWIHDGFANGPANLVPPNQFSEHELIVKALRSQKVRIPVDVKTMKTESTGYVPKNVHCPNFEKSIYPAKYGYDAIAYEVRKLF